VARSPKVFSVLTRKRIPVVKEIDVLTETPVITEITSTSQQKPEIVKDCSFIDDWLSIVDCVRPPAQIVSVRI